MALAPTRGPVAEDPRLARSEVVARHLEEEIARLALPPGHRVGSRDDLRHRFRVAPATVNEAVRILQGRGVIATRPGPRGGIFVAAPNSRVRFRGMLLGFNLDDAPYSDCLIVRNALEPLVCYEAMKRCTKRDYRALRSSIDAMRGSAVDARAFLRSDWDLHRRIADLGANAPLKSLYKTLLDFVEEGIGGAVATETFNPARSIEIHERLIEAIIAKDVHKLDAAIKDHEPMVSQLFPN
jgi:GntR family transcriptional regulator, transcriptional repressor for pyruvate dehydrogenase complex